MPLSFANIPTDVLRCIFEFLLADDVFRFVASCTQLWNIADTSLYNVATHGSDLSAPAFNGNQKNPSTHTIFNNIWRKAGIQALRRYERLTGPFNNVVLASDLISTCTQPENLQPMLNHFTANPLNSLTIEMIVGQPDSNIPDKVSDQRVIHKLKSTNFNFIITTSLIKDLVRPPVSITNQWFSYFLNFIDPTSIDSIQISLHVSLLPHVRLLDPGLYNIYSSKLKRVCLRVGTNRNQILVNNHSSVRYQSILPKLEWGFLHTIQGPNACRLHKIFFQVFLRRFLQHSQTHNKTGNYTCIEELHIICVLPEALQALRILIRDNKEAFMKGLMLLRITLEHVQLMCGTSRDQTFEKLLELELQLIIGSLSDIGFTQFKHNGDIYDISFLNAKFSSNS